MKLSAAIFACLTQLCSTALAADAAAWKSRSIYFVLTDRIARGSDDTGGDACGNLGDYCGGTFQGLLSKLDYIKGMGFDAIWLTPVVKNSDGPSYHGYWAKDLYSINSNYGTADDLKALVSGANDRGMYVMADVVANHMGNDPISENLPEPLNQQDSYHASCEINYDDQNSVENCWIAGLPDLNTQSETIRTVFQEWISWLVSEFSFSGIRIDTAKHVEPDYWPGFVAAAGVYAVGEVWDGDPSYLLEYAETMDAVLNYAIYYPVTRFYQQTGSSQDIVDMFDQISSTFPDPAALPNFIDNHDVVRFASVTDDASLLKNALAYTILARGIPIVYYGTEQGFSGGNDPANREDLWRSSFSTESDMYQAISRLSTARKEAGGLDGDDQTHLYVEETAYAWSRAGGDLIVFTTNSGTGVDGEHCFNTQVPNGSWDDTFGSESYTSDADGQVCVNVTNGEPVVLLTNA